MLRCNKNNCSEREYYDNDDNEAQVAVQLLYLPCQFRISVWDVM